MRPPLEATRHRRVFITGARGFVGRVLARRYRELGAEVRGLDVEADPALGVVAGDITAPDAWRAHLEGCGLVIHTAAVVTNNVDRAVAWHVNVVGTQRVLEAAAAAGAERFVHFSTMGVTRFGQAEPEAVARYYPGREIDERWPLMPAANPYVDTKIAAEHLVLAAHAAGEQSCTVVRPADVYGPGCRPWVLEPVAAIRAGMFLLPAHGQGLFNLVYVDDLVEGVVAAAEAPEGVGQIFQLGGEVEVTCEEYFGHFFRMLGRDDRPRTFSTPVAIAIAETARIALRLRGRRTEIGRGAMLMLSKTRTVSNAKAHRLLDWYPRVDLDEGMRRTEAWLRAEGLLDPQG